MLCYKVLGLPLQVFMEQQGEQAKVHGSGLLENMSTHITGKRMEDIKVLSVSDLDFLTLQLKKALRETGGPKDEEYTTSEEDKEHMMEEANEGW